MPHLLLISTPLWTFTRFQPAKLVSEERAASTNAISWPFKPPLQPVGSTTNINQIAAIRRSGNYPLSIWDDDYIQSLKTVYSEESYIRRAEKLKEDVRLMLDKPLEASLDQLKLIDDLQRLGVSYHFEDAIEKILSNIYYMNHTSTTSKNEYWKKDDLFAMALEFRLLRQHGFHVPQEVFGKFKDGTGNFNPCLSTHTKGLLSLYEASYLSVQGESVLEDARIFAARHLVENLNRKNDMDEFLAMHVSHALELPLHWRMPRHESRWFIEVYAKGMDMNPTLLELAKLDFNMVQAKHQNDLKIMSRWWRNTALAEKLTFARDRLMENFFWTVGVIFEPQQGYCRRMLTKVNALITTIDDVYDVYGTLDELVLFTDAVERWDINSMEQLPEYMKICFLALFNSTNEMAYDALIEEGSDVISYMKKGWADLCKSYLVEAKWYYSGYIPTLDEYLSNAWVSISAPVILVHIYFFVTKPFTKDALECLERYPSIVRGSSMILRLSDDLGTSSDELKRGDVPKSIQCYMHETGASEEDAREYIRSLIGETWKKMNEDRFADSTTFSQTFIGTALNLARMAQFMYQHGDGHGASHDHTKDRVLNLLIEPIPP